MKLGNLTLETAPPADLAAALAETTGLSAKEMVDVLKAYPPASTVASALLPFLKDAQSVPALANAIAKEGVEVVAPLVAALYTEAPVGKKS